MKRSLASVAICLALVLVMALSVTAFANSKGAVKVDMVVHTDSGTPEMPAGTVVGSANLNTTAARCLIVVVNLDDAVELEDDPETEDVNEGVYDCRIWINGVPVDVVDCLKVNANGERTANCKVDLGALPDGTIPDGATEILVNVVVRPYFDNSYPTPCYVNGPAWRTDIAVPLK